MNWSNLTPIILEKIMFYAAQMEKREEEERGRTSLEEDTMSDTSWPDPWHSTWLLTIEKFCRVSVHWKQVAFSSNILFPEDKPIEYDGNSDELDDEARKLFKAGFLSVVKKIRIVGWSYPEASKYIGNMMETSLRSIYIRFNIYGFTDENLLPIMDIISKSPNADYFQLFIRIESQNDAVLLWQLLLKIVHCNSKPKRICLSF